MSPSLAKVKKVSISRQMQPEDDARAHLDFQFLLSHTSPLEKLTLIGWFKGSRFDLPAVLADCDTSCDFSKLVALELGLVGLMSGSELLIKRLEPTILKEVLIKLCVNIAPALKALKELYSSTSGQLTTLTVSIQEAQGPAEEPVDCLEGLLEVCPCLCTLEADVVESRLINLKVLARHGPTLHSLALAAKLVDSYRNYSLPDIRLLLDTCTGLQHLATSKCMNPKY